jgi:hypothetical protein
MPELILVVIVQPGTKWTDYKCGVSRMFDVTGGGDVYAPVMGRNYEY